MPDGVLDGRAGRGRSNGGQDERLPNLRLQIMVLDGRAGRGDEWQNLRLKIKMSGGRRTGVARTNKGLNGMPNGVPDGPDGVPNGSHVIGHVIFECHVTRLGWQGIILLPTLFSQR
jgi:hypothetical protein